jgi:DNA-binding GntR family transcriptional regulator
VAIEDSKSDREWLLALVHDVRHSSRVRYRELARALRAAIESGDIAVGTRLPPQRELAGLLAIGRTTVVAAYNLLRAESLIVMRQGAGTWVVRRPPDPPSSRR